jgi:molybdenum cofactor cytidylyltransferase
VIVSRTFGLIPAAGKSRRMGRPKLTLPLKGRTVLEAVVRAVKEAGVDCVIVVVGPDGEELRALAESAGAAVVRLDEDTAEMRDTIERGLAWIEAHCQPGADDGWLLLPADHPCVDVAMVRQVLARRERSLVVPTFDGRRGHPTWIAWRHVEGIRALPRGVGLNTYLRQHAGDVLELPMSVPSVLVDLDTPEDYERLRSEQ